MTRIYTERPIPTAARLAWDYFIQAYSKPPIHMFFSPKADFCDTRAPGWIAFYGQEMYTSTWGAMCRDLFYVQEPEMIRFVLDKINSDHDLDRCPRKYMFGKYCEKCKFRMEHPPMLDLINIRERNKGQPDGYWKTTTAALCDEVEWLQRPPVPSSDLDNIRRMLDDGVPVPPWLARGLVERVERTEHNLSYAMSALQRADTERLALIDQVAQVEARRLADTIRYDPLYDAALAWDAAIERCDGIATAEEALREVVKELRAP